MSTVLTNGIIIPDNGSRNWGGDLANNWNIIDVNVGYMTDVKSKVTTLENSVAENTANIQTNASNISALQTSKQDVIEDLETIRAGATAGATAVQPNALNNYVDLSSEQTISGAKTFSGSVNAVLLNGKTPAYADDLTAKANDSDVVHKSGDETITGRKIFTGDIYGACIYNAAIEFTQTSGLNHGGLIDFHYNGSTKDYTSRIVEYVEGVIHINGCNVSDKAIYNGLDNYCDLGTAQNRFKDIYATNATINTSDRNAKTSIENIGDNLLDAWENVSLVSFKFKDAVEKKGDNARIHTGYIAQDVKEELNKHGIDACDYGLFCYDKWDAQEEKSHEEKRTDEAGNTETIKVIDTPAREAGETYGLRYIECLVVECAYLRKKNQELADRIAKLETNLNCRFN